MAEITRLNEQELARGIPDSASWHNDYKDTAWVRVLGLNPELTEGDIICVFSQFGEIEDLKLIRDPTNGRSKGFCFIKFEQFKSAVLTVDNFNEAVLLGRVLKVDHHREVFRRGKRHENMTLEEILKDVAPGSAYIGKEISGEFSLEKGMDIHVRKESAPKTWHAGGERTRHHSEDVLDEERECKRQKKERKREKKEKKSKRKKSRRHSSGSESDK